MESYEWAFPGSPVRVRLKLDIVPGIRDHLMRGWQGDSKQPLEAGGILLGKIQGNRVEISGFESFECAQQQGPFFAVKDQDLARFRDKISNQPDRASQAVGYFRSQARDTLSLHDDDLALIDAAFQNPFHVFLLVQPVGTEGWPVADFFFRDGETVFTESIFPFPFDQHQLETEARFSMRTAESNDEPVPTIPSRSEFKGRRRKYIPAFAAAALSMVALASTLVPRKNAIPIPDEKPLSLYARHNPAGVAIAWDPALPAIQAARIGILAIRDETRQEEIPLALTALQGGKFAYKTEGKILQVTLEVFSPEGQRTRETVIIPLGGHPKPANEGQLKTGQ